MAEDEDKSLALLSSNLMPIHSDYGHLNCDDILSRHGTWPWTFPSSNKLCEIVNSSK